MFLSILHKGSELDSSWIQVRQGFCSRFHTTCEVLQAHMPLSATGLAPVDGSSDSSHSKTFTESSGSSILFTITRYPAHDVDDPNIHMTVAMHAPGKPSKPDTDDSSTHTVGAHT